MNQNDLKLEMNVRRQGSGLGSLAFELTCEELGLHGTAAGSTLLQRSPEAFFDDFLRILERQALANRSTPGQGGVDQLFRIKGTDLYVDLLPKELRRMLWDLKAKIRDLVIESDESWIPWELMLMVDPEEGTEDSFLCECFCLTRWKRHRPPARRLAPTPMAMFKGLHKTQKKVIEELRWLEANCSDWQPRELSSDLASFKMALASGDFGGLHFAGHGERQDDDGSLHTVFLESGEALTPELLSGEASRFGKRSMPFVFWNCCHSVRSTQSITQSKSWPEAFLKIGAGAFVGTLWNVGDEEAFLFARKFYDHLRSGLPLGEAVRQARFALRDAGTDDWLAYVVYGDPRATLGQADERRISLERAWAQAKEHADFKRIQLPLLSLLAVAAEPLTLQQLTTLMAVEPGQLSPALEQWRDWLIGRNAFAIDDRMRKWLKERERNGELDLEAAHWRLVTAIARDLHGIEL